MKNRVILLAVALFGIQAATQTALASPPAPPVSNWGARNPGFLGPRLGGDLWKAPVATVNPSSLIPDDSADSHSLDGFTAPHFESSFGRDSFQLANAFNGNNSEGAKPIEKVEVRSDDSPYDHPATAVVAPPKSENKRIAIIALGSVALLAFRKFRRTGMPPRKPSFL
jgi:hypothetical protein